IANWLYDSLFSLDEYNSHINGAFNYSYFIFIVYIFFGPTPIMASFLNIVFNLLIIFYSYKLVKLVGSSKYLLLVPLAISLFPTSVLYSVILVRESLVTFLLLLSVFHVVKWIKEKHKINLIMGFIFLLIDSFFHGALL